MLNKATTQENTYCSDDYTRAATHVEGLQRAQCHSALYTARHDYAAALRRMAARPNHPDSVIALTGVALYDYSGWFRAGSARLAS